MNIVEDEEPMPIYLCCWRDKVEGTLGRRLVLRFSMGIFGKKQKIYLKLGYRQ